MGIICTDKFFPERSQNIFQIGSFQRAAKFNFAPKNREIKMTVKFPCHKIFMQ